MMGNLGYLDSVGNPELFQKRILCDYFNPGKVDSKIRCNSNERPE